MLKIMTLVKKGSFIFMLSVLFILAISFFTEGYFIRADKVSCNHDSGVGCGGVTAYSDCRLGVEDSLGRVCIPVSEANLTCHCGYSPICVPEECPFDYVTNSACILEKILHPESELAQTCCENACVDEEGNIIDSYKTETPEELYEIVSMFGQTISIKDEHRVAAIVNLVITSILGGISLFATGYGTLLAAYKRPNTVDPAEIEKISGTLKTLLLGFIISWGFIFIIQFFSTLVGIGNLSELIVLGDNEEASTTIVIN